MATSTTKDPIHDRLLAIVLTLPGAYEDRPWGSVHCKVAGKIFVGWGRDEAGEVSLSFKTDKTLQSMLVASDPRFSVAKYVGKHGWVEMKIGARPTWGELEQFIAGSYALIAPKKLVRELEERRASDGGQRVERAPSGARRNQSSVSKSATRTNATIAMTKPSKRSAEKRRAPRPLHGAPRPPGGAGKQARGRSVSSKKRA